MRALAIVPARGGSKRIPRKNIRPFAGKPIIAWSIETARASGLFDTVMVSTDDPEIAAVAEAYGAQVPFLRSAVTADDHAGIAEVLREVLAAYAADGKRFTAACCLYATAPFTTADDLREGRRMLDEDGFDIVLPLGRFAYPIWRSLRRDARGGVELFFPEHAQTRSQDLPFAYHDAGQWIWLDIAAFMDGAPLLGPRTGSLLLPDARVQDIDDEADWVAAERKFAALHGA